MTMSVIIYFSVMIGILAGFIGYTAGKVCRMSDDIKVIKAILKFDDIAYESQKTPCERMREHGE